MSREARMASLVRWHLTDPKQTNSSDLVYEKWTEGN